MNILLDTHSFIWLDKESMKMSEVAREAVADSQNTLFLSLVSVWEIQIKVQLSKLVLQADLEQILEEQQAENNLRILPIEVSHAIVVGQLPLYHKDPFDRALIAQAMVENLPVITVDPEFKDYGVELL